VRLTNLPYRQIHLDFHTSPEIRDVAADFDADAFSRRMRDSHVNSVNLFARCHHGVCYYPSNVAPRHPHLKIDLMGQMIDALHRHDIDVVIYITVARDEYAARAGGGAYREQQRWRELCMNNGFIDYVLAQTREVLENYEVEGIWFDIVKQPADGCVCNNCIDSMLERCLNPASVADRRDFALEVGRDVMRRMSDLVWSIAPEARVYFNSRLAVTREHARGTGAELEYYSHLEVESLPSGGWGYLHFPYHARYLAGFDIAVVGMTSRFNKGWGDCGSSRYNAALEYECLRMLALGCQCSIGDQLNPRGVLENYTYDRIARVYAKVEEHEPWCEGARLEADIGVLIADEPIADYAHAGASMEGALKMLDLLKHQYHVVDGEADFGRYRLLILPDVVRLDEKLFARLEAYLERGGRLLLSHRSGLESGADHFALNLGLQYRGELPFSPDYVCLTEGMGSDMAQDMFYVMYERGSEVALAGGGEVLAYVGKPYFKRDWLRFSGQGQTPVEARTEIPAVVRLDRAIYAAHPLFAAYALHAHEVDLKIVESCLRILLEKPLIRADLPLTAEVTVTSQNERLIVHVMNYVPQRLARAADIVVDAQYVKGTVWLRCKSRPQEVYFAPGREPAEWVWREGYAEIELPLCCGHAMVVVE